jgi:hypothetical protein
MGSHYASIIARVFYFDEPYIDLKALLCLGSPNDFG